MINLLSKKSVFSFLFVALLLSDSLSAQINQQPNSAEILLGLEKLNTVGSVLYIAAHPDDENTRLLAYLSKERKVRTGYLSITRGDGGQNLIGKEQGDALGLIRTQELLAARRTDGAEQFFTRANDFGYSKNPEETFSIWERDSILSDMVWTIRRFKPDVIICRFPTTGEGGHGHHTASAILAMEAFDAAADPKRFPHQLAYTQVWQAKRIFWNTFNFGGTNTTSPDQLQVDVGVFNPLLGKGYGEIAAESRSMHKSQGFGSARVRGSSIEYFKLLKGEGAKKDLFEGIDQSWKRFPSTTGLQKRIDELIRKYNAASPETILPDLENLYKEISQINSTDADVIYWKERKLQETENLILACAGIWMEAAASSNTGIPGNTVILNLQVIKRNPCEAKLQKISFWQDQDTLTSLVLKTNELFSVKHIATIPATTPWSNPYWLNEKHEPGAFTIRDPLLIGKPENEPALKVKMILEIGGLTFPVERPVLYKYTDPVKGEVYSPFEILPPATVNISDKVYVFSDAEPKSIHFTVKADGAGISGTLQVKVPEGWEVKLPNNAFNLVAKGDETSLEATITPGKNSANGKLEATLVINGTSYSKSIRRIEYDHIPYQFILSDAEAGLVRVNLKKAGNNIGYIPGAGDEVPGCLKQIGYNVTILTDELLSTENLNHYNAIITGVRAYNVNERLQAHYTKLMDYVKNGGNLIVQYNTNNRIGPVPPNIGPYPFTISRDRVTNEKAEMKILKADHPAFNVPNKIEAADFNGWVQERGIYFAGDWDKNYVPLFSLNDPGEKASEGSLLVAAYGKGNFVYTGLVFFRELPAGVPGAYRLLVNLLSLPAHK
jgi:LmbE family N-acetylglucosaminyl deacetylase